MMFIHDVVSYEYIYLDFIINVKKTLISKKFFFIISRFNRLVNYKIEVIQINTYLP